MYVAAQEGFVDVCKVQAHDWLHNPKIDAFYRSCSNMEPTLKPGSEENSLRSTSLLNEGERIVSSISLA